MSRCSPDVSVAGATADNDPYRADKHEEERKEDGDEENTEDVGHHVRVAALPENGTQHLCRIIPESAEKYF